MPTLGVKVVASSPNRGLLSQFAKLQMKRIMESRGMPTLRIDEDMTSQPRS